MEENDNDKYKDSKKLEILKLLKTFIKKYDDTDNDNNIYRYTDKKTKKKIAMIKIKTMKMITIIPMMQQQWYCFFKKWIPNFFFDNDNDNANAKDKDNDKDSGKNDDNDKDIDNDTVNDTQDHNDNDHDHEN